MDGSDVYEVLRAKRIEHLHHANTVTTSCSLLSLGGLASRGHVERTGLPQTAQPSDLIDKTYGIWHDIFTDTADIHDRARRRNYYGPVLFVLEIGVLNHLPRGADVLVTKTNPVKWTPGESAEARFFATATELETSLSRGTFDQMVVLRIPTGILPFPDQSARLVLDEPRRSLSGNLGAFDHASSRLVAAAEDRVRITIEKRTCRDACTCAAQYAGLYSFGEVFG